MSKRLIVEKGDVISISLAKGGYGYGLVTLVTRVGMLVVFPIKRYQGDFDPLLFEEDLHTLNVYELRTGFLGFKDGTWSVAAHGFLIPGCFATLPICVTGVGQMTELSPEFGPPKIGFSKPPLGRRFIRDGVDGHVFVIEVLDMMADTGKLLPWMEPFANN